MSMRKVWFGAVFVALMLSCALVSAQDNMGKQDTMGNGQGGMGQGRMMSVTGCLRQGTDTGGYYLKADNGKMYELMGKDLGEHIGHEVTVSGHEWKMSNTQEEKRMADEKSEAGDEPHVDMRVTHLKMVSTTCK